MSVLSPADALPLLSKHYAESRLIPFLGSGFSKPLGLPVWSELSAWIAKKLDFDPDLLALHGSDSQIAEYLNLSKTGAMKDFIYYMTTRFDAPEIVDRRKTSRTHKALGAKRWKTVYTTNYDAHIQGALEDAGAKCSVLASIADFLDSRESDATEVVMFHGSLRDPATIVLTESRYFERMALDEPVDQKLRADLLSNSFIFIGYSFTDPNIRYIWNRMHMIRSRQQKVDDVRLPERRCYFTSFGSGPIQPKLLEQWQIDVIAFDPAKDKSESVAELLEGIGAVR